MWPFQARSIKPKKQQLSPPIAVGQRFTYLGVQMLCIRHWQYSIEAPVVVAEYANAMGEIKQVTFAPCDWQAVLAESKGVK